MEDSTSHGPEVTDEGVDATDTPTEEPDVRQPDTSADDGVRAGPYPSIDEEPDTFPRSYVEELRQENGRYRQRAQRADELAQRLHRALVEATGRLADPTDLPFDEDHLDDAGTLTTAIDELLARKPHLAARTVTGDIGQGVVNGKSDVDLMGLLRGGR